MQSMSGLRSSAGLSLVSCQVEYNIELPGTSEHSPVFPCATSSRSGGASTVKSKPGHVCVCKLWGESLWWTATQQSHRHAEKNETKMYTNMNNINRNNCIQKNQMKNTQIKSQKQKLKMHPQTKNNDKYSSVTHSHAQRGHTHIPNLVKPLMFTVKKIKLVLIFTV